MKKFIIAALFMIACSSSSTQTKTISITIPEPPTTISADYCYSNTDSRCDAWIKDCFYDCDNYWDGCRLHCPDPKKY